MDISKTQTRIGHTEPGRVGDHIGVAVSARSVSKAFLLMREEARHSAQEASEPADTNRNRHLQQKYRYCIVLVQYVYKRAFLRSLVPADEINHRKPKSYHIQIKLGNSTNWASTKLRLRIDMHLFNQNILCVFMFLINTKILYLRKQK